MSLLMVGTLSIRDVPINGGHAEYTGMSPLMVGTLSIRDVPINGGHTEYTGCPH